MDTSVLLFLAVLIFCFVILILTFPKFKIEILYTYAIGGAINANIFNVETYGFNVLNIRFGIDSILYSLFVFCVILAYLKVGRKDAIKLMLYTITSLIFTAIISFFGTLFSVGYDTRGVMWSLLSFTVSGFASFIALYLMIIIADKIKKYNNNNYLIIFVMFVVAMILNTSIFYGIMFLLGGVSEGFVWVLLGNAIGKVICLILCLISFYIINIAMSIRQANKENNKLN